MTTFGTFEIILLAVLAFVILVGAIFFLKVSKRIKIHRFNQSCGRII